MAELIEGDVALARGVIVGCYLGMEDGERLDDLQDLTKPKATRSRRRAASWSGSTAAMGLARCRCDSSSRRVPRCR